MARWAIMLNRIKEEMPSKSNVALMPSKSDVALMPSKSDVARADDVELQEIMKNVARSTENLTAQLEGESPKNLPMHGLLGLDKQLRSIRGSFKVEMARKVQMEKESRKKSISSRKSETIHNMTMEFERTLEKELPS